LEFSETFAIVSTPRSGQHLLAKNLEYWHPSRSIYCEGYRCLDAKRKPIENCALENSYSIRLVCSNGRTVVKNHDFDLDLVTSKYKGVLILWRKDWYAILISWYLFELSYGGIKIEQDSVQRFEVFVLRNIQYLFRFTKKYSLLSGPKYKHIFFEDYRSVDDNLRILAEAYEFIFGELPNITEIPGKNKLRKESFVSDFKYYDQELHHFVNSISARSISITLDEFYAEIERKFPQPSSGE
jgi:hypothetical protein